MAFKLNPWVLRAVLFALFVLAVHADADDFGPRRGGDDWDGDDYEGRPPWWTGRGGYTATTTASSSDATSGSDSGSSSGSGSGVNGFGGSGSNSEAAFDAGFDIEQAIHYRTVHGVLAAVAFVAMFPLGASFVRVLPGRWAMIMHALCQVIALLLFVCAAALGIWLLVDVKPGGDSLLSFPDSRAHPVLGIIILILIFAMPVLGFLHHSAYKRHQRRTGVSHVHIWLGRFLLLLGIINGGLGLKQAEASHDLKVGYAIVAAVSGCIWIFFVLFGAWRKRRDIEERDAALLAAGPGGVRGGGVPDSEMGDAWHLPPVVGVEDGGHGSSFRRSGSFSTYGRRTLAETEVGTTRRLSEETEREVRRNKSDATARHDAVSEISSRI